MSTNRLDGIIFEKMLRNGLTNLINNRDLVNKINVFPVADGDTGTNMITTLNNGLQYARSEEAMGAYLKMLSEGMVLGARGNSGVILSQLFNGIFIELSHCGSVNPRELTKALVRAYKTAYAALNKPVEGTMLTVAKDGIEYTKNHIVRSSSIEDVLSLYITNMQQSLNKTPELLPVLGQAGVVDSGGQGYVLIFEGMLKYLFGEELTTNVSAAAENTVPIDANISFDENSTFELGYCMEFVLQRLKGRRYCQSFNLQTYISELEKYGNSIAAIETNSKVKVHIHTKNPARIIMLTQDYGEFTNFKLENMDMQHSSLTQKSLGIVCVGQSEQFAELVKGLGCEIVIDKGDNDTVYCEEYENAIKEINAREIVLFANINSITNAMSAAKRTDKSVHVIPINSIAQQYLALAMDIQDSEDSLKRIINMKEVSEHVISVAGNSVQDIVERTLIQINNDKYCEDREMCIIFVGAHTSPSQTEVLKNSIENAFPFLDVDTIHTGQLSSYWILGIA